MKSREEGVAYVLKTAKEQNVRFIRLWFTDILGSLKSVLPSTVIGQAG